MLLLSKLQRTNMNQANWEILDDQTGDAFPPRFHLHKAVRQRNFAARFHSSIRSEQVKFKQLVTPNMGGKARTILTN